MNLTTSKKDLLRLAQRMSGVAQRKGTMPALALTRLTATQNTLRLEATDLFLSLDGSIPAEVTQPGSFAVSAHDLVERVKSMPDGPVVIESKGESLILKTKGSARRFTLRGMSGDDFPPVARPDASAAHIPMEAAMLGRLISHTIFSIATDETRAHLNSALLEIDGGVVRMVSTDGHRCSKIEIPISGHASASMLIPLKAVNEIRRVAEDVASAEDKTIRVVATGPHAFFVAGGMTFGTKLVDAQFPPWRQVVPDSTARVVRVQRAALADAIKAVSVAANDRTGGIKLSFAKGVLTITSEDAAKGEGVDTLAYELVSGNDGALIGVNAKYPLDILGALSVHDEIDIGLTGELDPMTWRPVGDVAGDFVGVVMPMRI